MRKIAAVFWATLLLNAGCALTRLPAVEAPVRAPAEVPGPREEADMIAQEAVNARVTMLLYLDRLRGFRFSRRLMLLGGWAETLSGTGIDPLVDVRRAFVASRSSHFGQVAVVLQHSAPEDRVSRSLAAMRRKWKAERAKERAGEPASAAGARVEMLFPDPGSLPFPAAYREAGSEYAHAEGPLLVAAPRPGIVAILPPEKVAAALRLAEVGGLPAPRSEEAIVFRAWEPRDSVLGVPMLSADVRYADVAMAFDAAGNSTLSFRAVCTSAQAARREADELTRRVDDAQTIGLGGLRMRLFDFVQFHAENERVKMMTHLYADDVDWIVAMTTEPM